MILKEIIENLDTSEVISNEGILEELGYESRPEMDGIKCYLMCGWDCEGEVLGLKAYTLDNELIAIGHHRSKGHVFENFRWVSRQKYSETREYIESLFSIYIDLLDLEEEPSNYYLFKRLEDEPTWRNHFIKK